MIRKIMKIHFNDGSGQDFKNLGRRGEQEKCLDNIRVEGGMKDTRWTKYKGMWEIFDWRGMKMYEY
jgi:hypothetical protein